MGRKGIYPTSKRTYFNNYIRFSGNREEGKTGQDEPARWRD